jgi:dienelactone hydrolase
MFASRSVVKRDCVTLPRMRGALVCALYLAACVPPADAQTPSPSAPSAVRAAFVKQLDRPRIPLEPKVSATTTADGVVTERLTIATERKRDAVERVPMLLVRPRASGRKPAVIVLHGTGGTKERQRDWLLRLAAKGIIGVAIDARYHGERAGGASGSTAYVAAIIDAWRGKTAEHPFYYDTVWDLWRTVDYLQSRPDVDPKRIGMIGFSMGGIETWMAAADERIKVVVPAIAVQSFRWSLEHDEWQGRAKTIWAAHEAAAKDLGEPAVNARVCRALWTKLLPGILGDFDGPSMLRLIAPRPLLIPSGELDPNNPIGGARVAFAAAEDAYRGARDHLQILVAPGVAHKVTEEQHEAALTWFVTWLKP